MKPKFLRFPLLALALASPIMAGQYSWSGSTSGTWTDPTNWTNTTPASPDTYPNYGTNYTGDNLRIANGAGNGAVYNPGSALTTTFTTGRGIVIGGSAAGNLTITSGTLAAVSTTADALKGNDPIMGNNVNATLLINGGTLDVTGVKQADNTLRPFHLVWAGGSTAPGITSEITISSGTLACNNLNLQDGGTVGTGIINLNGGVIAARGIIRNGGGAGTSTINLDGGTLRASAANTSFFNALANTQTLVKGGGAKIEADATNTITIAAPLLHDPALGVSPDGGLTKTGTAGLTLSGTNTYNGGTTINGGSLIISSDANLGDATGGLTFGASTNLNISASIASSNRVITLNPGVQGNIQLAAGVSYTNSGKVTGSGSLRFRQTGSGSARVATLASQSNDFTGSLTIDQQNTSQQIGVTVNSLADGVGYGNIICTDLNTSTFPSFRLGVDAAAGLTLTNRRIELAGAMNTGSFFIVSNENTTQTFTINSDLLVSGTAGNRRLSLSGAAGPVNVFAGSIADGTGSVVSLTKTGGSTWTVSGNNSHTGGTTLNGATTGSQLNINSATALGTGTFSISGGNNGKIDNTSGSALTLSTNNAQSWGGNFTFVGSNALNLGNGAVTLGANRTISVTTNTLTVGGNIGESAAGYGITKDGWGTLALTGTSTYTGKTTITTGKLDINSIADFGVGSAIGAPPLGTHIQLGSGSNPNFGTLSYSGAGGSTNRTVQLGDATAANDSIGAIQNNSTTGALTFTAGNFNTTITGITAARTLWLGGSYTGGPNEIQGVIQDNDTTGKVNVGKAAGNSIWLLSGANTYTGSTIVQAGGALKLGATGSIASSSAVSINAGGTLDTSAQATHTVPGTQPITFGIDATGSGSSGKISATGLNISNAVVSFNLTGTPNDPVYVLATYTSLTGTPQFASVTPPSGYALDYAYEGNKIALVQSASGYSGWQSANGTTQAIDLDHDNDGVSNGVEYFLFGNANSTGFTALPSVVNNAGTLSVTWPKGTGYAGTYPGDFVVQTSTTLSGAWVDEPVGPNVTNSPTEVKYTFTNPLGTRKFVRLKVTGP